MTDPNPADSTIYIAPGQTHPMILVLAAAEGTQYLRAYVTCNGSMKPMDNHVWHQAVTT